MLRMNINCIGWNWFMVKDISIMENLCFETITNDGKSEGNEHELRYVNAFLMS